MANEEHLAILKQGVEAWNAWRTEHPQVSPDLALARFAGYDLAGYDLGYANLAAANLARARLDGADLTRADLYSTRLDDARLTRANLGDAILAEANLARAELARARLDHANLAAANLARARLDGARLDHVLLSGTIFADVDLSGCKGLETCQHATPSIIDIRTLQRSGPLPLAFLRGVGLPENLIDYLPSLLNRAFEMYSCFISYSSKDEDFAQRLHADLQNKGVRCWFAPENMKTGDRIETTIDTVIRLHDKLLVILSETSITRAWVRKEVQTALAEEERDGRTVLFPVRIDNAVMDTTEQWADDIRRTRHIGDFRRWKEHDSYQKALDRLLRDLRVGKG